MRAWPRSPSTLTLLSTAFATILAALALGGAIIHYEADRVSAQTRQIMENGIPSVVAAARLQEILPTFRLLPFAGPLDKDDRPRFEVAARHFAEILQKERQAKIFFPGEQVQLRAMQTTFQQVLTDERVVAKHSAQSDSRLARLNHELDVLELTCKRFERVNEIGMDKARSILSQVAKSEHRALLWGFSISIALAFAWAILLTRAIARPLFALKRDASALDGSAPKAEVSLGGLVPREIWELAETFKIASNRLRAVTAQREAAQDELYQALAREHQLNGELSIMNASLDHQVQEKTAALEGANQRLAVLVAELRQRDASKSEFLAKISHELRTPLAVIKGAAMTVWRLRQKLDAKATELLLSNVVEEADHLSALVDDLLDASRMDAGTFRIVPEPGVELRTLIESVVAGLLTLLEENDLSITCEFPPQMPLLIADAERLRQVVRNLLENAARFAPVGSNVQLEVKIRDANGKPARVEVTIADAGPGVPAALQSLIFMPFVQGAGNGKLQGGAGLGLAIARQLVEAHGGEIGVISRMPTGSIFHFWLPIGA
jgi:signal transduction histidine kinase